MNKCSPRVNDDGRRENLGEFMQLLKICIHKTFGKTRLTEMNICSQKTQMHAEVKQLHSGFIEMNICSPQNINVCRS